MPRQDHYPCKGCGIIMRHSKLTAAGHEGTVNERAKQMCGPCYRAHIMGEPFPVRGAHRVGRYPNALKQYKTCEGGCGLTLRPGAWKAKEHPGTVAYSGNGRCASCRIAEIKMKQRGPVILRELTDNERRVERQATMLCKASELPRVLSMLGIGVL